MPQFLPWHVSLLPSQLLPSERPFPPPSGWSALAFEINTPELLSWPILGRPIPHRPSYVISCALPQHAPVPTITADAIVLTSIFYTPPQCIVFLYEVPHPFIIAHDALPSNALPLRKRSFFPIVQKIGYIVSGSHPDAEKCHI